MSDGTEAFHADKATITPKAIDACKRAVTELEPCSSVAEIAGMISKLQAIIVTGATSETDKIADTLVKVDKAARDVGPLDAVDREGVRKATANAQLTYLRSVSPAAADAWERSASEAGRGV